MDIRRAPHRRSRRRLRRHTMRGRRLDLPTALVLNRPRKRARRRTAPAGTEAKIWSLRPLLDLVRVAVVRDDSCPRAAPGATELAPRFAGST